MNKPGMSYSDVRNRILRIQSNPGNLQAKFNLIKSLKNQVRLREGEKAMLELDREISHNSQNGSHSLSGTGTKQIGMCMKFDCVNKDRCNSCIKGSAYSPKTLEGSAVSN